jgi:hypothetical protein
VIYGKIKDIFQVFALQQAVSLPSNAPEDVDEVFIRYGRIASKDELRLGPNPWHCEHGCIKLITEFLGER